MGPRYAAFWVFIHRSGIDGTSSRISFVVSVDHELGGGVG
jgi:hypothetical protein